MSFRKSNEGGQSSCGDGLCSCCPCDCYPCHRCLQRMCLSCCPYLSKKGRYAFIEYKPVPHSSVQRTLPSLLATRESLMSLSARHFPHESVQSPHTIVEDDEDQYDSQAITTEPKSLATFKHPSMSATSRNRSSESEHSAPMSESPYDSADDLGVELGFIDYQEQSSASEKSDDRNIRIRRTPEPTIEDPDLVARSLPAQFQSEASQRIRQGLPSHRSFHVDPQASPRKPLMQFSLYFDEKHSVLIVHLLQAFNLPTKRDESASNPFVEVYLLPSKTEVQESRVIHQTLNPVFDQAFKFKKVILDEIRKQLLIIRIYLNDKHHFIGGVLFPLEKADLFGSSNKINLTRFDEEEGLKDKSKGDILISMSHHPEAGTLEVLILEACNLKKQELISLVHPYVKVIMIYEGNRVSKWKTTVKKNTLMPVFNELCLLDVGSIVISDLQVEVVVMDYDRFGRNSEVGSVTLGSNVASKTAQCHWNEVVNNPNTNHIHWHVIGSPDASSSSRLRSPRRLRRSASPASCVSVAK